MRERKRTDKLALAFLAGGAAGAVAALLLAPQSGVRTRRKLLRTCEDLCDRVEDYRSDLEHDLGKLVGSSKSHFEKGLDKATELANKVRDDLVPTIEKGRELLLRRSG